MAGAEESLLSRGERDSSLGCELSKECGLSHRGPVGLKGWGVSRVEGGSGCGGDIRSGTRT